MWSEQSPKTRGVVFTEDMKAMKTTKEAAKNDAVDIFFCFIFRVWSSSQSFFSTVRALSSFIVSFILCIVCMTMAIWKSCLQLWHLSTPQGKTYGVPTTGSVSGQQGQAWGSAKAGGHESARVHAVNTHHPCQASLISSPQCTSLYNWST